jgi:ABC-type branched-subunit amino acid transport system substrate-binding protein
VTSVSSRFFWIFACGLVTAASCRPAPRVAEIGYAYGSTPEIARVAQLAIDSLWPNAPVKVRVTLIEGVGPLSKDAIELANTLVNRPAILGVVGHAGSRESFLASPIYANARVSQLVPTGTSRRLRESPWTFMVATDDSIEGAFIISFVERRLAARRVQLF